MPTYRALRRRRLPSRICPTLEAKWDTMVERVRELQTAGRPVLIGTRSVAASQTLSEWLQAGGVEHVVLNAAQDSEEAAVRARRRSKLASCDRHEFIS